MKKLVIAGLIGLLVLGLAGAASANPYGLWKDVELVVAKGTTGSVDIECNVRKIYFSDYIQPGEQLVVRWRISNEGDCPVDVYVTLFGVPWYLQAKFFPGLHFKMAPGTSKQVALGIRMALGTSDAAQDDSFAIHVVFKAIQDQNRIQTP